MKKKIGFIILILFNFVEILFPVSGNREVKFRHISLEEGLSQGGIKCMLQDNKGFMWFGTWDGLNKYDGYTFKIYRPDPENPNSLSNNIINAVHEDHTGVLWIGTNGGGLNKFDREKEQFIDFRFQPNNPTSLSSDIVTDIHEDRSGVLWIGTDKGLNKFHPETGTFTRYRNIESDPNSLSSNNITSIYEDRSGILWIGTNGGGFNKFDPKTGIFVRHQCYQVELGNTTDLSSNAVTDIYEDHSEEFWIGTANGLNRFDRETGTFRNYRARPNDPFSLSSNRVRVIYEDSRGKFWIGTLGGGIDTFDRQTERFVHYRPDPGNPASLSSVNIISIYEDRSGALWIGTDGGGINHFDHEREKFRSYRVNPTNPNSLSDNMVRCIYEDREGVLWIGTQNGGLNKFNMKTETFTRYRSNLNDHTSLSSDSILCVYEDSTGVLWIGTIGVGLDKFDRETGTFRNYRARPNDPYSLSSNFVRVIYEDSRGKLWVGTLGGGIDTFDRETEHFHTYRNIPDEPTSLGDNWIRCIYEDRNGVLWIGTQNGGLNKFNRKTETFTRYRSNLNDPTSLSSDHIQSIYQDPSGIIWVGTYGGGLDKFDPRKGVCTRHYRVKHGLPNNAVYGILPDEQGCLWLSTNKGLSKFDPCTETFKNYTYMDGLQSNEFNVGAYYKSKSGEMFFGGVNGFNAFYPDEVKDSENIPPIVITDFQIFNKPVDIGGDSPLKKHITGTGEIKLSYKDNVFSFKFAALDYTIPGKNQYKYMMEGFDREWIFTDASRRFASYTNLDPGEYTFRVKGSNNDGVWNEEGTSIKIVITPPFWQTWWFRLLGITAISFLILTVYKIRIYGVRKRSKQLEKINAALNIQIAERKMLEEKLLRQEKLAVLGQLAGGVGHELRNPLGAIRNSVYFLNMVLEKPLPDVKEALKILEKEVTTSDRIITSLLDFARSRPPLKEKVNINDIIREKVSRLNVPENIEVKSQTDEFIPLIMADPTQLDQIFGNILLNAIQAMPEGGQLIIKTESLSPDRVTVSITDTGVGIPRENLEKIFEPLFTGKAKGIGLGMAIAKTFVEGNGGTIDVQSERGKGSTFTLRLPIGKK